MTKARDLADLLDATGDVKSGALDNVPASNDASALTTGTLANARLPSNISDSGTEGTKVSVGTTAQRGSTTGQWRFNSDTGFFEGRTASTFQSLEPTPTVSSVDVTEVDSNDGGNTTFVITGTNFASGITAKFVGSDSSEITASTTTLNSATQVTAVIPSSQFVNSKEPYDVKVVSSNGLTGTLADQINVDSSPTWSTASGSLGTVFDSLRGSTTLTATATDADGDTITYSVQSGSLPSGASLNSSTGAITGFNAVGSDTTSNFTLRAAANSKTVDRAFSIVVKAPTIQAFTSSGTWTVPTGLTTAQILVVAGGGSGGTSSNGGQSNRGAGGGAGGLIYISNWDVTGASSYTVTIGNGGTVGVGSANSGQNTTVSGGSKTLTALGGGHGGFSDNTNNHESGGSGGGGWYPGYGGRSATQPANTSDGVNTYNGTGFGNAGGTSSSGSPYGAGGGGAGGVGDNYNNGQLGGAGKDYSSVFGTSYGESGYFASGGTSGGFGTNTTGTRIGGGGGGYNSSTSVPSNSAANGQANTGGGGGSGGNGGSGVVLIKF